MGHSVACPFTILSSAVQCRPVLANLSWIPPTSFFAALLFLLRLQLRLSHTRISPSQTMALANRRTAPNCNVQKPVESIERSGKIGENRAWASGVKKMHQTENRWQYSSYFRLVLLLLLLLLLLLFPGLFVYFLLFLVGEAL